MGRRAGPCGQQVQPGQPGPYGAAFQPGPYGPYGPQGAQGLGSQGARDGGQKKFPWKIVLAIAAVLVVVLGTTVIADVARNANDLTTRTPMTQAPAPCPGRGRT